MNTNEKYPFVFYLSLDENLPAAYYILSQSLKVFGFMLIPVQMDQIQKLVTIAEQNQIIIVTSVVDSLSMNKYNEKVRRVLKYILKSKRISLVLLSSFSKLDDKKIFKNSGNYFFIRNPVDSGQLSSIIADCYELKSEKNTKWPGGKRAGLGAVS